jgi:group II intron reverse transcriptase/maturase
MNIGEMQKTLSLKAEKEPNHRFDNLFGLVRHADWLQTAHDAVATNAGSKTAGCDGITMVEFDEDLEGNLKRLREALTSETFVACPVRRVYIPKANGKVRPLGIPSIRDRIVQEAVRMILEPIYEADFCQSSHGFRPTRCTMDAVKHILWYTHDKKKYHWVIEGDISAYFDTIHHRTLMQLLRRRVKDTRLLNLIWGFLRAGVMERRLFKDTKLGTPQGGIISPLLANVYLHELDKYMERYTALSAAEKTKRRRHGQANFTYVRYADDWVVLCNGTRAQAEAMRDEIRAFLSSTLHLTLSMEKTRITHVNDGFDFLGFYLRRSVGQHGMATVKVLIPEKALRTHREKIRMATDPSTHEESIVTKTLALNRVIAGWCRYYQYASKTASPFGVMANTTFWSLAHWICRKYQQSIPVTLRQYKLEEPPGRALGVLVKHTQFKSRRYMGRFIKPNPYTVSQELTREELPDANPWLGQENDDRLGMADRRRMVIERDELTCQMCGKYVGYAQAQVDHKRTVASYKNAKEAHRLENLWTLCYQCHERKTENDRQMESRMQ